MKYSVKKNDRQPIKMYLRKYFELAAWFRLYGIPSVQRYFTSSLQGKI